jgi:acyl-CoA thioester hydrolase
MTDAIMDGKRSTAGARGGATGPDNDPADEDAGGVPAPGFAMSLRVYYEDTDAGGVVYYANHLRFYERCRTEWLRAAGVEQRRLAEREGLMFVVAGAELQYLRPARLDDELRIDARVAAHGASYVVFEQRAWRGTELLSRGRVKVACVDAARLRPRRLPAALAAALNVAPRAPAPARLDQGKAHA